ncbi:BTB/POZ domain-containing protein 3-like [Macrosteles quadrilineatus]|uniref:BTB/POZ domain-containing protein 3-like n=1 Tax=Macrosteles quadrilineatus TaxID=74068 RepID=UPI0023E155EC|nr:BTB/POZ domain-containing protein 3-like [Macrosteles quadrilineatus]XP_054284269.1 BTB/POZ domain-containing protein 3-like [Macrosteles quadrilineatus]
MSLGPGSAAKASGMEVVVAGAEDDPDFITFLFDPEEQYNCYFVVGNPEVGDTERIGVVKKMLLAHSVVFRAELQTSKIAEKNDVKLPDVFPQTFKNLLRFVYGYDNTQNLSFDEADNLLYVADKYWMSKLKNRLAIRLMSLLNLTNICSLMNNPACYTVLELNSMINEILQAETEKVLASPQFPDLSPLGFLTILQQEVCNVPEIDLWTSAIEWATHRVSGESKNGEVLRDELNDHLKHIRICTLSDKDLMAQVVPSGVLTYNELKLIGDTRRTEKVQPDLTTICNKIEKRQEPLSELMEQRLSLNTVYGNITNTKITINTKGVPIQLCSVKLYSSSTNQHQCNCTITLQKGTEPPTEMRYQGLIDGASNRAIPIILDDMRNVCLSPNSTYLVKLSFCCGHSHSHYYWSKSIQNGKHFDIGFQLYSGSYYVTPIETICYKTARKNNGDL